MKERKKYNIISLLLTLPILLVIAIFIIIFIIFTKSDSNKLPNINQTKNISKNNTNTNKITEDKSIIKNNDTNNLDSFLTEVIHDKSFTKIKLISAIDNFLDKSLMSITKAISDFISANNINIEDLKSYLKFIIYSFNKDDEFNSQYIIDKLNEYKKDSIISNLSLIIIDYINTIKLKNKINTNILDINLKTKQINVDLTKMSLFIKNNVKTLNITGNIKTLTYNFLDKDNKSLLDINLDVYMLNNFLINYIGLIEITDKLVININLNIYKLKNKFYINTTNPVRFNFNIKSQYDIFDIKNNIKINQDINCHIHFSNVTKISYIIKLANIFYETKLLNKDILIKIDFLKNIKLDNDIKFSQFHNVYLKNNKNIYYLKKNTILKKGIIYEFRYKNNICRN